MLSVSAAQRAVLKLVERASVTSVPLDAALGLTLARDVVSPLDSPPYDKSLVDGFAVLAADAERLHPEVIVQETITAGEVPRRALAPGHTARIMTGAPIPPGTAGVIMLEESEALLAEQGEETVRVRLNHQSFRAGQNILRQGIAMQAGERVLQAGDLITPAVIGLLAETGHATADVPRGPQVAILSTGNELVPAHETPGPGQIRNSNGPMLAAQVRHARAEPRDLGIVRDERDALAAAITQGRAADILLLSGGVSAGDLDLAPGVLQELGIRQVFHKVQLKPGKPLWFGVGEAGAPLVFGLPGNPVSSFVCFELFVRPTLRKMQGQRQVLHSVRSLPLAAEFSHRGGRPAYLPATVEDSAGSATVRVLNWAGSADLRRLAEANALAHFPPEPWEYQAGDSVEVMLLG